MKAYTGPTCQHPGCHRTTETGTAVSLNAPVSGARCPEHQPPTRHSEDEYYDD